MRAVRAVLNIVMRTYLKPRCVSFIAASDRLIDYASNFLEICELLVKEAILWEAWKLCITDENLNGTGALLFVTYSSSLMPKIFQAPPCRL
jgi:hypothetical protein